MPSRGRIVEGMAPTPARRTHARLATSALLAAALLALLVTAGMPVVDAQPPPDTRPAPTEPRFAWPLVPAPRVTRAFDPPDTAYGPGHRGVDLSGSPGQDVRAAGAGFVVFAGRVAGRGVVSIDHDGRLRTTYEPVRPSVAAGDQVYQGQVIGTLVRGHAGCAAAACLHWGVRRGGEYLNPLRLVRVETRLRLKPWQGVLSVEKSSIDTESARPHARGPPSRNGSDPGLLAELRAQPQHGPGV